MSLDPAPQSYGLTTRALRWPTPLLAPNSLGTVTGRLLVLWGGRPPGLLHLALPQLEPVLDGKLHDGPVLRAKGTCSHAPDRQPQGAGQEPLCPEALGDPYT